MRSVCDDLSSLATHGPTKLHRRQSNSNGMESPWTKFFESLFGFFLNEKVGVVLLNLYYVLVEIDLCHHHPLLIWKQISSYNSISFKSQRPQHLIIAGEIYGHRYRVIW